MKQKKYLSVVLLLIAANIFICSVQAQLPEPKPLKQQRAEQEALRKQQQAAAERKAAAEKARQQKARAVSAVNNYEMVYIPGGTFTMGSPEGEVDRSSDETQHSVTLSSYYMGSTEVPQALWKAVMGTSTTLSNPSYFKGDDLPVEQVSWDDCQTFIRKLNQLTGKRYRLPTEAEWEYACRAGTTTPFNTGNNLTTDQANYNGYWPYNGNVKGQDRKTTTPVGSFAPNGWGLYDMHGNVYEWCSDWYGDYPTGAQTNPQGASSGSFRVFRGGHFNFDAQYCRSAYRSYNTPTIGFSNLGFRLVSPE